MFDNARLCSECNGQCCQIASGCAFPCDFGLTDPAHPDYSKLIEALNSGNWTIDKWSGDPRVHDVDAPITGVHLVRPRQLGDIGLYDDRWYGGVCVFWVDGKGCKMGSDERPYQCRMLEPRKHRLTSKPGRDCISHDDSDRRDAAEDWLPYNEWLSNFATSELRKVALTYGD